MWKQFTESNREKVFVQLGRGSFQTEGTMGALRCQVLGWGQWWDVTGMGRLTREEPAKKYVWPRFWKTLLVKLKVRFISLSYRGGSQNIFSGGIRWFKDHCLQCGGLSGGPTYKSHIWDSVEWVVLNLFLTWIYRALCLVPFILGLRALPNCSVIRSNLK